MNYTLLIYERPEDFAARKDPERHEAYWAGWPPYKKAMLDAGVFVSGAALQPTESATSVTMRDGQRVVQDGPYAETKEQLGGFIVIDVPDLDAALAWAARCPIAPGRAVEVRPNLKPME